MRRTLPRLSGAAFTLVEMLVVMVIISVLAALLLPSLIKARDAALGASCSNRMKQLCAALLLFSDDCSRHLPGNHKDYGYTAAQAYKNDWLGGCGVAPNAPAFADKPVKGTVFPYAGDAGVYRCPGLSGGVVGSGVGSNGRFDYTIPVGFTGARITQIKSTSQVRLLGAWIGPYPTPLLLEENPARQINLGNRDGGFDPFNYMASTHHGGSNYASLDMSVRWFSLPGDVGGQDWRSRAPSGAWTFLGSGFVVLWGEWSRR